MLNLRNNSFISKYIDIIAVVTFVAIGVAVYLHLSVYVCVMLLFAFIVMECIFDMKRCLLSITGFLGVGIVYWLLFTAFITSFLIVVIDGWVSIACSYGVFMMTWCFYSLLANNKVANTANQLLSALFAMIVLSKDTILSLIPDYVLSAEIEKWYTVEKSIEMAFNLTFSPILTINIVTVALCTLKGYWIEQYNQNRDIGES